MFSSVLLQSYCHGITKMKNKQTLQLISLIFPKKPLLVNTLRDRPFFESHYLYYWQEDCA